jgi:hypothetical protein
MIKKFCSCGKKFLTDSSENKCPDCKKFNEARCSKPIVERRPQPDEIHIAFYPTYSTKIIEKYNDVSLRGFCTVDEKTNQISVTINLFNFDKADKEVYKDIVQTINHEYLHVAITLASDSETSHKADSSNLLKRLMGEGYL